MRPAFSRSMICRRPSRKTGWSSAITMVGSFFVMRLGLHGEASKQPRAHARTGLDLQFPREDLHALVNVRKPETRRGGVPVEALPIVGERQMEFRPANLDAQPGFGRSGV